MNATIEKKMLAYWGKHLVVPDDENKCWGWSGTIGANGRAVIEIGIGKRSRHFSARKFTYQLLLGIEDNWTYNTCLNPLCCNPKHCQNRLPVPKLHIENNEDLENYKPEQFDSFIDELAWGKFLKHVVVVKDQCWEWKGAYNSRHAGSVFPVINVNFQYAHFYRSPRKLSYRWFLGITDFTPVNICNNPVCCNPDHRRE